MTADARVQVVIIGAGPAGLMLGWLLARAGIDFVILERHSREHVLARIRAGVLEQSSVDLLISAGLGTRLEHEALRHDGVTLAMDNELVRVDFGELTAAAVTVYGQTEITRDLYAAHDAAGTRLLFEVSEVALHDLAAPLAQVSFHQGGARQVLSCDFVAGCDGFHGVSRAGMPAQTRREYERVYPGGWLGVLCDTPPVNAELVYASHPRGFALCSMRSPARSRYYVQVDADADLAAWPDERFWDELRRRLPEQIAARLITGPAIEKSIAPLRSFVVEPMRYGNLLLAGDAAHIVPPTGAKGLNLALADCAALAQALIARLLHRDASLLESYSATRLAQVWRAERFSWWFTSLTHRFDNEPFARRLQQAEFAWLAHSRAARQAFAESYVGASSAIPPSR